ncbi:MAG: hypothetical protein JW776_15895 [Candidatus Lokiarchaeota archaeon]|nr:hypothetical protein [Candidatus Lokiarchaeota archaeon]
MRIVDLRSDTVTKPSPEMWEALKSMDNNKLGDDVEHEDPTVNKLEEKAARLMGMPAALFVTSGTQGNLISILSQTRPGEEILLEEHSHVVKWEVGGVARIGGLMVNTFPSVKGTFNPSTLSWLVRDSSDIHQPVTSMIALENTHNYHGGIALKTELFSKTRDVADEFSLKVHLDGARIFNACVALKVPITEYTRHVHSIQFCLSKGLSCPIGSIIAGSEDFIEHARKIRKLIGGGFRQGGIIAVMGLIALEPKWIQRLEEDHAIAKLLAKSISEIEAEKPVHVPTPDTNIVMVEFKQNIPMETIYKVVNELHKQGVLCFDMGPRIRLVTHYGITKEDIDYCIPIIQNTLCNLL